MKKNYFFIAALAIGMMSSCSNNEILEEVELPSLPDQVIDEGTTRMPIELGISDPSFSVSTRGTGTVGDLAGEATNLWNGQPLGIFMVEKNTMTEATIDGTPIFDGMTFKAPVGVNAGNIIMYHATENVKYYPLTKAYDFYGYHLGATTAPTAVTYNTADGEAITEENPATTATVTAVIDGTQDIMAGKAMLTEAQKGAVTSGSGQLAEADYHKAYSSWSARQGIKPSLSFKHMLSRLVFNVKAGEAKAASGYYTGGQELDNYHNANGNEIDASTYTSLTDEEKAAYSNDQAVYITNITVKDQANNLLLTFTPATNSAEATIELTDETEDEQEINFVLMERAEPADVTGVLEPGDGDIMKSTLADLVALTATCPEATDGTAKQVGESMMIFPGQESFVVDITVKQYVQTYDDPEYEGESDNDKYAWKEQTMTTIVKAPENTEDNDAFAQGKSYNVNVTIFGYQRIEVEAVLEGWIAGDDVEVNPEDDAFNQ